MRLPRCSHSAYNEDDVFDGFISKQLHMSSLRRAVIIGIVIGVLGAALPTLTAQDFAESRHTWQVFLQRDIDSVGTDTLTFVDMLTGETIPLEINGERYTPVGNAVLYYDTFAARMMLAEPDGTVREHPFIQPSTSTRRLDWVVSADTKKIAWTTTEGSSTSLSTVTQVATLEGDDLRTVLMDGPREGIRALPVAFNPDYTTLYMDFQPDALADLIPYPQYAGLMAVDLIDLEREWGYLPGEPSCYCGAGFGSGLLLRLQVSADQSGFDVRVDNLAGEVSQRIAAQPFPNFTQSGDILISPNGRRAVYAISDIRNFGRQDQTVRTIFMLVDLEQMTQTQLTDPINQFMEPLHWTEDNTAIIFTSKQDNGTWKITIGDARLTRIAEVSFLGSVN
jgi:hypothetical protein